MAHCQRAPRYAHTFIDSCAFDPGGEEETASRRIMNIWPNIIVAHSVQKEISHPNTPDDVKQMATAMIYTEETDLTPDLSRKRDEIRVLIQGNATPGQHKNDADHLFELYKYGGGYFVTTDQRLLSYSVSLFRNYFITTITPTEYEALL